MTELSKSYKISRSVTFYAEKLNLDSKHFSNSIKEATGRLASEWIETYIVLEAKVMLRSTEKTIQQISDELNFANQSFFGKYFRKDYSNKFKFTSC
jgi:AraC-like DNA-binding protein